MGEAPAPGPAAAPPPDLEEAETVDKGHGRIERRRLWLSREVVPCLHWPGAAQVCRIERTRERAGKTSREISYAITSLPRARADASDLLNLVRQHWSIENRLHYRRDTAMREDASRVRSGNAPQALASLRNTALRLIHHIPEPLPAIRETFAENRIKAIALVKNGFL